MSFIASLPMYDWPERRAEVDAEWAAIRDALRERGVEAPDELTREVDEQQLWRHPELLFGQTCWGPMELGLAEHVQVVGQPSYDGVEGGDGELYSSAIVMRAALSSPLRGGSAASTSTLRISPLVGEMSDRTEGGNVERSAGRLASYKSKAASIPLELLRNARFAYNGPNSMSGLIGLTRDLETIGESLDIFAQRIESGGHRNSIKAIAEGRADVTAIDCRSWQLAQLYEPAAQEVQVVGWTAKRRGLPFITAKGTAKHIAAVLRSVVAIS